MTPKRFILVLALAAIAAVSFAALKGWQARQACEGDGRHTYVINENWESICFTGH